jgi:hypothetical protein
MKSRGKWWILRPQPRGPEWLPPEAVANATLVAVAELSASSPREPPRPIALRASGRVPRRIAWLATS